MLVGTISVEKSERLSAHSEEDGRQARGAERQESRARSVTSSRRPAAKARSRSPPTWPAAVPTFCSAAIRSSCCEERLQESRARPTGDAARRTSWNANSTSSQGGDRKGARRSGRARRPAHRRHRAARIPPHRQPASRPRRPPGRSRQFAFLSLAAGRSAAHLRRRAHAEPDAAARHGRGCADRVAS